MRLNTNDFKVLVGKITKDCQQVRDRIVEHKEEVSAKQLHLIASLIKHMFGPCFLDVKELLARYAEELNEDEEEEEYKE